MLSDFLGGPPALPPAPPAAGSWETTSPFVSWARLGQANCNRYSVLIREIALLSWLAGSAVFPVTSWIHFFDIIYPITTKVLKNPFDKLKKCKSRIDYHVSYLPTNHERVDRKGEV
ncbi:hypothetical protein G9C98_003144 [Cotesia typhae]|uniref:Uncharacterized protein n=1 Tax=Cotesia typhae TaxID=2053667 RepID=A0A8J5US44_9HYME|nr:hypothetical protein G9C98_003144 [Cotesia typhae]